jgi:hypothetical protein
MEKHWANRYSCFRSFTEADEKFLEFVNQEIASMY